MTSWTAWSILYLRLRVNEISVLSWLMTCTRSWKTTAALSIICFLRGILCKRRGKNKTHFVHVPYFFRTFSRFFAQFALLQFVAYVNPSLYMRTNFLSVMVNTTTDRVLKQTPLRLLNILEHFFDVFGQIVVFSCSSKKRGTSNLLTSRGKTVWLGKFR